MKRNLSPHARVCAAILALVASFALASCSSSSVGSDDPDPIVDPAADPTADPVTETPVIIVKATGIALDVTAKDLSIGGKLQLAATVSPADASNKAVSWKSDNASAATVSDSGLVTAIAPGAAVVTATAEDGGFFANCAITVLSSYAVAFDTASGTAIETQSVESGSKATKPADPTRAGYTFAGWFADQGCTDPWDFAADVITGPTTIYAKWVAIDYAISFNANGGSGATASITAACDSGVTLPAANFEAPPGYVFLGWSLSADGTSANVLKPGATAFMQPNGLVLYAIWGCAFTFTESSGKLAITGLSSNWPASGTSLAIPSAIDGKPVTAIAPNAFRTLKTLKSVTIASGVTEIGTSAFEGCAALESVAFPDSLKTIRLGAYFDCVNLGSVSFPNGLTTIEQHAFWNCAKLTSITIPASVTSLSAGSAFGGCAALAAIDVAADNAFYCSDGGIVYNKAKTTLVRCPQAKTGTFVMPNTVTVVQEYAFSGCAGITSVTWSSGLDSIEQYAFSGCTGLTSISFPSSLTFINYSVFTGCSNLSTLTLNAGLQTIRMNALSSTAVTALTLPASVTDYQFQEGLTTLASITVDAANAKYSSSNGVLYSKDQTILYAYPPAKTGTAYTVLSTVTKLERYAFNQAQSLETLTLPTGLTTLANDAIGRCASLKSLTLPSTVSSIGYNLLWSCQNVKELVVNATTPPTLGTAIPNTVTSIKVPSGSVSAYKAAQYWSESASRIVAQ